VLDGAEGRASPHLARSWGGGSEARGAVLAELDGRSGIERLRGVVARQLWAILLPALLIPGIGCLALARMPTLYTATGTVIYDPAGYTPDVLQSILKTDPTTDTIVASQGAILGSLSIAHRVAASLDLAHQPAFATGSTPP
jgi:uncharacterized protein involved in exopolysaccharide biosynthesis